jgi:dTDP-4-dehydrorhamnose 3,5-epimerase-like enzyme
MIALDSLRLLAVPALAIDWHVPTPIVSDRDAAAPAFF